ncbi:MAG: hypothetical protein HDS17_07510 [Bacteroides sp.]|nr:hypothetical protein [Bacteroides sp.]
MKINDLENPLDFHRNPSRQNAEELFHEALRRFNCLLDGNNRFLNLWNYRKLLNMAYCEHYDGHDEIEFRKQVKEKLAECFYNGDGCVISDLFVAYWRSGIDTLVNDFDFLSLRFRGEKDRLAFQAAKEWNGKDKSSWHKTLDRLLLAEKEGSIAAKAILGKLEFCAPDFFKPLDSFAGEDVLEDVWMYNKWYKTDSGSEKDREIRRDGLRRLIEARDAYDESANYTIVRIYNRDESLFYMSSPFEP